jgi:CRP-like cAMP-binding protein
LTVAPLVGPTHGQPARIRIRSGDRKVDPEALYEERIHAEPWDEVSELPELAARAVNAGTAIVTQGEAAEEFFIIVDGHASVWQQSSDGAERRIETLGPGQAFGEVGILKKAPHTKTVRADEKMELLSIQRRAYLDLAADFDADSEQLARLIKESFISKALRKCLRGLREEDLPKFGEIALKRYDRGEWIIREGEASDSAYVIVSGGVEVLSFNDGQPCQLTTLAVGELFGEIGVLERCPRTASVRATERTVVATIQRELLESL